MGGQGRAKRDWTGATRIFRRFLALCPLVYMAIKVLSRSYEISTTAYKYALCIEPNLKSLGWKTLPVGLR